MQGLIFALDYMKYDNHYLMVFKKDETMKLSKENRKQLLSSIINFINTIEPNEDINIKFKQIENKDNIQIEFKCEKKQTKEITYSSIITLKQDKMNILINNNDACKS